MTDLEEMRERADRRITDCDTRNLFIRILDHLIEQERAASSADASPKPWSEEDIKAVVEPNDSMVNKLIELKDQRDEARNELDAANARIAELEAYKAGIEALPVGYFLAFDANGYATGTKRGRFIPAEGE